MDDLDMKYEPSPVCPYCKHKNTDELEVALNGDGDECIVDCEKCGEEFIVTLNLEATFSTRKPNPSPTSSEGEGDK